MFTNEADLAIEHAAKKAVQEAEQRRIEEEKQAAREREWQAKAAEARRVRNKKVSDHLKIIAQNLTVLGHKTLVDEVNAKLTISIDGYTVDTSRGILAFDDFSRLPYFQVGGYRGEKFRQRKSGYNYQGIAMAVIRASLKEIERTRTTRNIERNRPVVEELRKELGLPEWSSLLAPSMHSDPRSVIVRLDFSRALEPEQVRTLVSTLRQLGIVEK